MERKFLLSIVLAATLGLAACGSGGPVTDGVCSVEEKADAKSVLEGLDANPLPSEGTKAIEEGCRASKDNKDEFMAGLLGQLNIDPACATDADLQSAVDNWEGADLSDIPGTCSEGGPGPSESPVGPQKKIIDVTYDVFSIKGRGQFLVLNFAEPIKTETVAAELFRLLGDTSANVPLENPAWNDTRTSVTYQVSSEAGDYRFQITGDGDAKDHLLNAYLAFSVNAAETADDDGDGVANDKDQCPGTDATTKVAGNGCPELPAPPTLLEDSDKDGVSDDKDKCPDTLAGMGVDEQGCLIYYHFQVIPNFFKNISLIDQAPKVTEAVPGNGANAFPSDWPIVIKFDQPMDVESVKAHVKLEAYAFIGTLDVPLQFVTEYGGHTVFEFKPAKPLKAEWAYNIVIEKGVKGDKGTTTEDITWSFLTKK